ncbi:hypothetical protein EJB05_21916, partial [Eragrostis curvula]
MAARENGERESELDDWTEGKRGGDEDEVRPIVREGRRAQWPEWAVREEGVAGGNTWRLQMMGSLKFEELPLPTAQRMKVPGFFESGAPPPPFPGPPCQQHQPGLPPRQRVPAGSVSPFESPPLLCLLREGMDRRVTRRMKQKEEEEKKKIKRIVALSQKIIKRAAAVEEAVCPRKPRDEKCEENDARLTWTCKDCKAVNRPERRLLTLLPVLICQCGSELPKDSDIKFKFSMHKAELNDHFLIPNIRRQNYKECSPSAMLNTAEICWRVKAILCGLQLQENEPLLNRDDLLEKYNFLCMAGGIAKRWDQEAVEILGEAISTIGIESEGKKPKLYKLPHFTGVKMSFPAICRLLADGYAIRTSIFTGKKFRSLKPDEIYKSPKRGRVRHAITLIGAGRRRSTYFYYFLNSWGRYFCMRRTLKTRFGKRALSRTKARGGFGMIRADDICTWPDFEYYKEILDTQKEASNRREKREAPEEACMSSCWRALQASKPLATTELEGSMLFTSLRLASLIL